jgi:hypothetical protein
MPTNLVNFTLADGTTAQYLASEPEATFEPGEYVRINNRRKRIVLKSKFTIPAELNGQSWLNYCAGKPQNTETQSTENAAQATAAA